MNRPHPRSQRDVYANLLRDTRGLRREQASARDAWFEGLPWDRKEDALFELEMLLKGITCFGNPRNHPGSPRRTPDVAHDFHEELRFVREAVNQSVQLVRLLLGERDRAYTFSRYLETVLPDDSERSQLLKDQLSQDTPQESLFVLRNAFSSQEEIVDGLLRLGRISHRLYFAIHGTLSREIGRNAYFNPLVSLEFRPEFDRIRSAEVLEALERVRSEAAHRVMALTFLALFRGLKYVALIDEYAASPETTRLAYIILSVLRSDMRALTRFLGRRAAEVMADGFERELLSVRADEVQDKHGELASVAASLVSLRGTLETVANGLRIEVRKTFERDLPAPNAGVPAEQLGPQIVVSSATLRASLHHAIRTLCVELAPERPAPELVADAAARKAASDRLRRDVWMFAQILRGFLAKARASKADTDRWAAHESFHFVREFLSHFRAIGYQLVRASDYERLDPFLEALANLRDVDLLEPERLEEAVEECAAFYRYLNNLFDKVSKRSELREVPFDRRAAAETLKIYLGAA